MPKAWRDLRLIDAEARAQGLPTSGYLSNSVDPPEGFAETFKALAHARVDMVATLRNGVPGPLLLDGGGLRVLPVPLLLLARRPDRIPVGGASAFLGGSSGSRASSWARMSCVSVGLTSTLGACTAAASGSSPADAWWNVVPNQPSCP